MTDTRELLDRLHELADRVAVLEKCVVTAPAAPRPAAAPYDGETFWALDGLRARAEGAGAVLFAGTVELPTAEHVDWQQGVPAASLLDDDWAPAAETLAALGQPVRLVLLRAVLRGTRTVAGLGAIEGLGTTGQLYHHLRQLVAAGWLRSSGRGRYEVPARRVVPLLVVIAAVQS